MTDGVNLGSASLGLEADLAPLRADLADAKARVATAVAEMQALLDSLHVGAKGGLLATSIAAPLAGHRASLGLWAAAQDAALADVRKSVAKTDAAYVGMAGAAQVAADSQVAASARVAKAYAAQAEAARLAADVEEAAAARAAAARGILGGVGGRDIAPLGGNSSRVIIAGRGGEPAAFSGHSAIWGVRGANPPPFSTSNPGVVVVEAASRTPLGGLAAAIGENSAAGGPQSTTIATERNNQRTVITSTPGGQERPQRGPGVPVVIGLDAQRQRVMQDSLARALTDLEAARRPNPATDTVTAAGVTQREDAAARATGSAVADALAAGALARGGKGVSANVSPGQFASAALADLYAAKGLTAAPGPDLRLRVYGEGGVPGTHSFGVLPGAAVVGAAGAGGRGGSGGGGGFPPWLTALLWGHAGGGGGGGRLPGYGGALLGGAAGLGAGIGSIGSFAGFGPEHIILTAGGIIGSGVAALGGGALLGAGALGKIGVGAGSDLAVLKSTIADTKTLQTSYDAVAKAVAVYGKNSEQAKVAQKELNYTMAELQNTAGVKAELALAKAGEKTNEFWDRQTSQARVEATKLLSQFLQIAHAYIPLVASAAQQNLALINENFKPLSAWLKGPEGMGIFLQLENEFKNQIPTAMHALTQGFEFFAKTVAYTAPLTGGLLRDLDKFFTKWNTPSEFAVWEGEMNKLINDFHVWGAFIKILAADLFDLFNKDAHTGEGIIEVLTHMLDKVHEYENSTAGSAAIHNIFTVHKAEVIALLEAIVPLVSAFSHIYTTVSPLLVEAVTNIAEAFTKVVTAVEKTGPLGTWVVGLTLIAAKLKALNPLMGALKTELLGTAAAEEKNAAAATSDAAATAALAGSEVAAGAAGIGAAAGVARSAGGVLLPAGVEGGTAGAAGLLSKSTLLKAGIYGVGGLVAGSLVASATGAKGNLASALGDAGAGAGVGFALGGPLGAVLGAGIGASAPYVVKAMTGLFSTGTEHAVTQARREATRYSGLETGLLGPAASNPYTAKLAKALEAPAIITAREAVHYQKATGASSAEIARLVAEAAPAYRKAGELGGQEFIAGEQHVRFPSRLGFLVAMEQHLNELPAAARSAAAKTMLAYAEKLEAEGRLPQGVVAGFVTQLEQKVGGLTAFLVKEGAASAHALRKSYELTEARSTLKNSLVNVEQLFGVHFKDTTTGVEESLQFLNEIVKNNKGPLGQAAKEMAGALKNGLEVEWIAAKEVNAREIKGINKELNTEIKQLGGSEIRAGFGGHTKTGAPVEGKGINLGSEPTPFGKAAGGLLQIGRPGEAGRDTVGLNVGGLPIAVGPGEQVAVFNRHQQPIVNSALAAAGYGGLSGLFNAVSTPNYMAAGGLIPDVVRGGLSDVRKAEHARVGRLSSMASRDGVAASGGRSAGTAQMRAWAKAGLEAAGVPATRGNIETIVGRMMQESGGNPNAINLWDSNAAAGHPSQGLMQTIPETFATYHVPGTSSNILNPVANVAAAVRYMLARYGHLVGAGPGGYALGGLLSFAGGGIVPPAVTGHHLQPSSRSGRKVSAGFGHGAKKNPKGASKPRHYSGPLTLPWNPAENQELYELGVLLETTIPSAQESYGNLGSEFSLHEYGSGSLSFVVTEGPLGEAVTPHEDPANVQGRLGQLHALFTTESQYRTLLISAQERLGSVNGWIAAQMNERHKQIRKLQERIKRIRGQIEANLKKLARLEKAMEDARTKNQAAISSLEGQIEKAENAKHPNYAHISALRAQLRVLRREDNVVGLGRQIKRLREENKLLGGDETAVGSHGELGPLEASRDTLQQQLGMLGERRSTLAGDLQGIQGVGGAGGTLAETAITLAGLNKQIGELSPESIALQVARAVAQSGGSGTGETALELAEREKAQLEEKLKISKEETRINAQALGVFGGPGDLGHGGRNAYAAAAARGMLIPASWIPSFDVGGIVSGPIGAPQMAIVHGGEQVLTPEQQGGVHFHQHNEINTLTPADPDMLAAIGRAATRGQRLQGYRIAKRLVPGV